MCTIYTRLSFIDPVDEGPVCPYSEGSRSGTSERVGTIDVSTTTVHSFSCKVPFLSFQSWSGGEVVTVTVTCPSPPTHE
jgi:hypothetical protein